MFSPDGSKIAFVSDRDKGLPEIYVMNVDGTDQIRLTSTATETSFKHLKLAVGKALQRLVRPRSLPLFRGTEQFVQAIVTPSTKEREKKDIRKSEERVAEFSKRNGT